MIQAEGEAGGRGSLGLSVPTVATEGLVHLIRKCVTIGHNPCNFRPKYTAFSVFFEKSLLSTPDGLTRVACVVLLQARVTGLWV